MHALSLSAEVVDEARLLLGEATRAVWRSELVDYTHPLIEAVMPDDDGVIRARWEPLEVMRDC